MPRSKPDAAVKGSTDGLEIHVEALVTVETKSIVELVGVDIGIFIKGDVPTREEVEEAVRRGSEMLPLQFPNDSSNRAFPVSLLCYKLPNGDNVPRDWLVWSKSKQALFCFPCRLFTQSSTVNPSLLALSTALLKNKARGVRVGW